MNSDALAFEISPGMMNTLQENSPCLIIIIILINAIFVIIINCINVV